MTSISRLLVVLAIALRAWAYLSDVSLWLDEMLVSRNILGLPLSHLLTKPLLLDQVAPRGFLLLEKLAVTALGRTELALRLFPFLCSIASVFLFHRLAQRALGGVAATVAFALFGRLMFYLIPGVLLTVGAGADRLRIWLAGFSRPLGAVAAAVLIAPVVALAKDHPPYEVEQNRAIYAYLQQKRQPGDIVHVFPLSRVGALFYGEQFFGLRPGDWRTSVCDRNDTRAYIRDVDRYRGAARVWLLSAGVRPFRTARPAVRNYLSTIGVRRDSLVLPSLTWHDISLDLYDLSDSLRLSSTNAESFPVAPMPTDPRPGCRPWSEPSPLDSLR